MIKNISNFILQADFSGKFAFFSILLFSIISLLGKLIIPDQTAETDRQFPELALLPPGSLVHYWINEDSDESEAWIPLAERPRDIGITYGWHDTLILKQGRLVTIRHWLGTDTLGRDVFSRLVAGTRISFYIGIMAVLISVAVGTIIGAVAGYYRGWIDYLLSWLMNVLWSIPTLLMVLILTLLMGKGLAAVYLAVGLTMWVDVARIVRGQMLGLREKEFAEAGRALGFRHLRILFRHLLPNTFSSILVIAASNFASAILVESGLSFLGYGVQPPTPSWGSMIEQHKNYLLTGLPWLALAPGLCIVWLVLAFTFLGNALKTMKK